MLLDGFRPSGELAPPVLADGPLHALATELPVSIQKVPAPRVVGDRFEYWADDPIGQFVAIGGQAEQAGKGSQLRIALRPEDAAGDQAAPIASLAIPEVAAAAFSVDMTQLAAGRYVVEAILESAPGDPPFQSGRVSLCENRSSEPRPAPFPPKGCRSSWNRSRIWPMPFGRCAAECRCRSARSPTSSRLAVLEDGQRIPAQITTRATWHVGGSVEVDSRRFSRPIPRWKAGQISSRPVACRGSRAQDCR